MTVPSRPSDGQSAPAPPPNPARALLDHVGKHERSALHRFFLDAVRRAGMPTPEAVVEHVLGDLYQRIARLRTRETEAGTPVQLVRFYCIVLDHPEEALALALDAFRTPEERAEEKAAREDFYRRAWMDTQPPTDQQLAFLNRHGYRAEGISRGAASRLIDAIMQNTP